MIKEVKTNYAEEKSVLAEPVYNRQGKMIYPSGTAITVFNRMQMYMEGVRQIRIYEKMLDYQLQEIIRPEIHNKMTAQLRQLVRIRGTKPDEDKDFKLYEVKAMMSSVVEDFLGEKAVIEKLASMRSAYEYLYQHSVGVMIKSMLLGTSLGLSKMQLESLGRAAIFHDIGMLFIPLDIMKKPKLTEEEYQTIKSHPIKGYRFLKDNASLDVEILQAILEHHERWDGNGYPNQKKGSSIHENGQIIRLADTFDSMLNDRPYRKAYSVSEVHEFIMSQSGTHFNPKLVEEFKQNINPYPINTLVELNDGTSAVVTGTNEPFHTRPVLTIVKGPLRGKKIDLMKTRSYTIIKTLKDPGEVSYTVE
ncbi:HD domain-containing protein [Tindallia magadiensis]|uniref:HD domain-containing protein n=1 Tax=Tindallia magadiensis TaxID=69895 RepID=A0A1I3CG31_9FIRM|nr:HD-GYP domain-containing protein [Tindallia magadiensis]SFH73031.1 HD domain-containing protein [Tindallia magadiensis]